MTTEHELIASNLLADKIPLLRETSLQIADPQVRYLGTLGGNVANGDPGNDMPAVMMCAGIGELKGVLADGSDIVIGRDRPGCPARQGVASSSG